MKRGSAISCRIVLTTLSLLVTACGGGGGDHSASPVLPASSASASGTAILTIPNRAPAIAQKQRRGQFVSPSSVSVGVAVNSGAPTYFDVSSSSPLCTPVSGGRTCTLPFTAPPGLVTFTISLYDAAAGGGTLLGTGTMQATLTAGQPFSLAVTLGPVVASVTAPVITYAVGSSFVAGVAGTATVTFTLADPDGNPIVASSAPSFSQPLTLASNDSHVTVTPTSWTGPSQTITLTYDGSASVAPMVNLTVGNGTTTLATTTATTQFITEFTIPTANVRPWDIAAGSDGALWFTESAGNKVGRMTTAGAVTSETPVLTSLAEPNKIVAGAAGALWFLEQPGSGTDNVGRITTLASVSEFTVPRSYSIEQDMTYGPDGAIWFTDPVYGLIWRINASGTFTNFTVPMLYAFPSHAYPFGIVTGPDGNLWFTDTNYNAVWQMTTSGSFTAFALPTTNSQPLYIAAGSDGALWFLESTNNKIGRITTAGVITETAWPSGSSLGHISAGPDGALWFVDGTNNSIWRMTTAGAFTEYPIPTALSRPMGIAPGPDGNMWFTEYTGNRIGRVTL